MGLTEKTLELNVTHELLALGQGIWHVLWATRSWPLTGTSVIGPPIYAAGLSLQDELEHGWDVSLDLPSMGSTPARVAFLQFKMGKGRRYSRHPRSVFKSPSTPNTEHVLFGINNNSEKNQHSRLRGTGLASGVPESAIYALPLFTDEAQVRRSLGGLLANTVFFSVPDVDKATRHDPIVDGTKREVAISKMDPEIREFRSEPVPFKALEIGGQLIGEIAAVRLHRALSMLPPSPTAPLDYRRIVGREVANEAARFLSDFVGVDTSTAEQAFTREIGRPSARSAAAPVDGVSGEIFQEIRVKRIFDVAKAVSPLLTRLDSGEWEDEAAHAVETKLLATAAPDGMRLNLAMEQRPASSMRLSYIVV
jgi:hypothetical protein